MWVNEIVNYGDEIMSTYPNDAVWKVIAWGIQTKGGFIAIGVVA